MNSLSATGTITNVTQARLGRHLRYVGRGLVEHWKGLL